MTDDRATRAASAPIGGVQLSPLSTVDRAGWAELHDRLQHVFRTRTRDEWSELLDGVDGCYSPVVGSRSCPGTPRHRGRDSFPDVEGINQPAPAPRFRRTRPVIRSQPPLPGEHTGQALRECGFDDEVRRLSGGVIR